MQDSSTSNFIFGVDEIVLIYSQVFTLTPDGVIFTGTPPGIGIYREPQTLLEVGDVVTVAIEGIDELFNSCNYL